MNEPIDYFGASSPSAFSFFKSASKMCFPALTLRAIAAPIDPDPIKTVTPFITTSVVLSFERCHINGEAVFHIAFQHTLVSCIDILDFDHFNIRNTPSG